MSTFAPDFSHTSQHQYIDAVQSRATILDQLIDVRADQKALDRAGITREQARAAFDTIRAVSAFYEQLLWQEAEQERQTNREIAESYKRKLGFDPDPVPVSSVVGETA
jgi:predicted RNA-binding protein associated with RNAse of E/G family